MGSVTIVHVCVYVSMRMQPALPLCVVLSQEKQAKVVRLAECWASHPTEVAILRIKVSLHLNPWRDTVTFWGMK